MFRAHRAVRPRTSAVDQDETPSRNTAQRLKQTSCTQRVVTGLLIAFLLLLVLDISLGETEPAGLECSLEHTLSILRCDYIISEISGNSLSEILHYPHPIFGKALDVTVCFGLASLLYAMRHASLGSTPFITYTCKEECVETGKRWTAKIRNDGLGPAIFPISTFQIKAASQSANSTSDQEWLDADATREILNQLFIGISIDFSPLGRGGAIAKDKEFTIFACDHTALVALDEFCMKMRFQGQYGSKFEKTIILVPSRPERCNAPAGSGGAAPAAPGT